MGRVVYLLVVLGLAVGAARLGLRLAPIRLDQYTPAEAIALALLVGLPVLLLGLVLMRLVWSKSAILVRAFEGLGMRISGTDATGVVEGVPVTVKLAILQDEQNKTSIRWVMNARVAAKDARPAVVIRAKKRLTFEEPGFVEVVDERLGDRRAWVATGGTAFRDAPQLPEFVDEAFIARIVAAEADELKTSSDGARVMVVPSTTAAVLRRALLLARAAVAIPLPDSPEPDFEAPARAPFGKKASFVAVPAAVAMFAVYLYFSPTNRGFELDALAKLDACPLAKDALGGDVKRRMFGYQRSDTKGKKSRNNRWELVDILLEGSKARGTLDVVATELGDTGEWLLLRAELESRGARYDLLRCGLVPPSASRDRTLSMTVAEANGAPPVRVGDACQIVSKAGPNDYNCRVEIRCGETALYGATPSFGFTLCGPIVGADGRAGLVTDDTDSRVAHDEPLLHLDEAAGFAELEAPDRAWKVRLSSAAPAK